jgi:hypothetical protein
VNIDDLLGAENFAAETGDAVLAKLDDGKAEHRSQSGWRAGRGCDRFHVNDIGRAHGVTDAASGAFFQFDAFDHGVQTQELKGPTPA